MINISVISLLVLMGIAVLVAKYAGKVGTWLSDVRFDEVIRSRLGIKR